MVFSEILNADLAEEFISARHRFGVDDSPPVELAVVQRLKVMLKLSPAGKRAMIFSLPNLFGSKKKTKPKKPIECISIHLTGRRSVSLK